MLSALYRCTWAGSLPYDRSQTKSAISDPHPPYHAPRTYRSPPLVTRTQDLPRVSNAPLPPLDTTQATKPPTFWSYRSPKNYRAPKNYHSPQRYQSPKQYGIGGPTGSGGSGFAAHSGGPGGPANIGGSGGGGASGGSGAGGGGGNEDAADGSGRGRMQPLTIAFALFVLVGGAMGYKKKRSKDSLIASSIIAGLLLVSAYLMGKPSTTYGVRLALVTTASLAAYMGKGYWDKRKIFPQGVLTAISTIMTLGYIGSL